MNLTEVDRSKGILGPFEKSATSILVAYLNNANHKIEADDIGKIYASIVTSLIETRLDLNQLPQTK